MGYMSGSNVFADFDGDGTRDGILRELNIGNGLNGTLINGVLSLEVTGGGGSANDGTITLTAGTNISGGGDFTTNQLSAEEITFNGLSDADIRALITGTAPISVSNGVVSFAGSLNDLSDVTITSVADTQTLRYNGTNFVNEYNDQMYIRVKAREAINQGEAVYIFDAHNSNVAGVKKARADSASTMPVIGIALTTMALDDEGLVVSVGKATGVAANFTDGDVVYASPTTAGGLTNVRPTAATHLVQSVGVLMQAHPSNASVKVTSVGRSNDVPNTISIAGGITAGSLTTGGAAALGDTTITGKLTVTGLIDPTGLELTPVASNPGSVAANTIWQDSANSNQWKIGAYRVADANNIATLGAAAGLLTGISGQDTDDLSEGSTNLYFTDARARGALSVGSEASASGDGGISYASGTGVFTYTPPDLSSYQVQDDILDDIAGLTQASDKLIYFDSATTAATSSITAFGRSILDDANAAAARTTLGVDAAGTDNSTDVTLVTVTDNYLSISGQAITAGTVPVSLGGTGATTASAARTALGVDAAGTDNSTDVTLVSVSGNYLSISGQAITAGTVPVSLGGTGATTASAARTALGVDAAGTDNSTNVTLATVSGNYLSISGQEITAGTVPVSLGGTGSSTASAARTALGLAIGSDVQAYDADLTALAGLTSTNDSTFIVGSATGWVVENATTARASLGLGTAAVQDVGNFLQVAGNLSDLASASAARGHLGVAIGSDVQAYDADLTAIAGLSSADGNFIVGSASGWVAESGATARTSLGLGTAATSDTGDFATAAQGTKADTAHGWGNHASAGYLTAEADTLSDVAGRGASTTQHITVGGITADTNTLHTDNSNNRVGIGTSSPATTLHVVGTIRQSTVTGGKILFADTNGDLSAVTIGSGISFSGGELSASGAAAGTVTSVAVSGSDGIQVDSGSPITSSGTIALGVDAAALRTHINVADGATANTGALADKDSIATGDIDPGAVTYAKIQNVSATDRILGRDTAGAGSVEELTPAAVKTMLAITESDITDLGSYLTAEADTLDTVAARGATTTRNLEAASFVKTSGTSSQFLKADGSVDSSTYLTAEADTLDTVAGRGATTGSSLTATSFVTTGGAANQFVKGDGSLDASTYLTSYTETDTLDDVVGRGGTSSAAITAPQFIVTGGTSAQFLKGDGTADATVYIPTGQYEAGVTPISAKGFIDTGTDTDWISQTEGSRAIPGANSSGSTQVFSNGVNGLVTAWNQDLVTTQGITYSSGIWTIDTAGVYEIHAKLGFLDGDTSGSNTLGNPSSSDFIQSFVHILFSSDGTDPTASEILVRGPVQLFTNGTGLSAKGTECRTVRRLDAGDKLAIGVFNRKQSNQSSSLKYRLRSGIYNECSIRRIG